jgi:hypothetical protein
MYKTFSQEFIPLISYFDSSYISGKNGIPLRYTLEIWNVRYQTLNDSHRTNNFNE